MCRNSQEEVTGTTNNRKTASKIATNGSLTMNKKLSNGGVSGVSGQPPTRQTLLGPRIWPEESLDEDTVDDIDNTDADIEHYATLR